MPDGPDALPQPADAGSFELASLQSYDHFVVGFSGGKDSLAAVLHLLELGVPKERIELAHHLVDGPAPHGLAGNRSLLPRHRAAPGPTDLHELEGGRL